MIGRPFPLLLADLSLDPDPRGARSFSYDDGNHHLPHPLSVRRLVWSRDLGDPTGTETLAEITHAENDGWPTPYLVYYLKPLDPPVHITDLAAAVGCTVEDLLQ